MIISTTIFRGEPWTPALLTQHKDCFAGTDAGACFAEGTGMGWGTNITPSFSELAKREKEKWHFRYQMFA